MRVKIQSTDRLGISQEILTVFAQQAWNVKVVEVSTEFTFVHLEQSSLFLHDIRDCLEKVEGIINIEEVAFLPTEQRENHLRTLLDRIPDPIIDIDNQGVILAVNSATQKLLESKEKMKEVVGLSIENYIDQSYKSLLTEKINTLSLSFKGKPYLADVTPVKSSLLASDTQTMGAMITLRSMTSIGRQLSLIQKEVQDIPVLGYSAKTNERKDELIQTI